MQRFIIGLTLCLLASFYCFQPGQAMAANDAPHNDANNISCGSCHNDTLLSSPFWGPADDNTYNNFCLLNCHNIAFAPYTDTGAPLAKAHSSANTSSKYGTWSINCVECHDPHVQRQKLWKGTSAADLFLASGKTAMPVPTHDEPSNTSIISYSSLNYRPGWNASLITDKTMPERRAVLFPNLKKLGFSYNVLEIDNPAGTIKVEGDATAAFSFVNPPTSYAIIYGQYIKQAIDVNGTMTPVKLFGNFGEYSFAYDESASGTDPSPNGICQVCHINTTHWNRDGSGAAIGIHSEFNGENCTKCHRHDQGFKNIYVDHSVADKGYILGVANCVSCHSGSEPVINIHKKNCSYCHEANLDLKAGLPAGGGTCAACHSPYTTNFQNGHQNETHVELTASASCTTTCHSGDLISVTHKNDCTNCHTDEATDGTLIVGAGGNGDASGHALGTPSSCADCHAAYSTNFETGHDVKDHTGIAASANCTTSCHTQTTAADIASTTHAATGCTNCHTNTSTNGSLRNAGNGNASNGSGNCAFCHADYNSNFQTGHKVKDHNGITTTANCATTCHTDQIISGVHNNNCQNCHTNTVGDGTLIVSAPGSCADCHPTYDANFSNHTVGDHSGVIANQAPFEGITDNCANCHTGDLITAVASGTDPGTHQNICTNCHTNIGVDGTLVDGANNYGDATGHVARSTSDCDACHSNDGYFASHTHVHKVSQDASDLSQEQAKLCSVCHNDTGNDLAGWADILAEHQSDCKLCHNATRDTSKSTVNSIGETIQTIIAANTDPTNCANCHRDKIDSISADATHGIDHLGEGRVTGAAQCTGCHDQAGNGNNIQFLNTIHGSCDKCHVRASGGGPLQDYSAGGSTIGEDINYRLINEGRGGSCATCHVSYASNFAAGHKNEDHAHVIATTSATPTLNCGGCHGVNIVSGANKVHQACNDCHNNTTTDGTFTSGPLGSATNHTIGSDSACADCHTANYFDSHTHSHTVSVVAGDISQELGIACSTCHDSNGATYTWDEIKATHQNDCNLCHNATRNTSNSGSYPDTPSKTVQDIIAANANPTGCGNCHRDLIDNIAAEAIHNLDHKSAGKVTGETQCMGCHDPVGNANNIQYLNTIHTTCGKCHVASRGAGALHDYSASGGAIGQFTNYETLNGGAGGACNTCHGATFPIQHGSVSHATFVSLANDCSGCHSGTEGQAGGMVVNSGDNKVHDSCATCHGTTGTLVGSAEGKTGANDCNSCHGAFSSIHADRTHETSVAMANDCNLCHAATKGLATGMPVDNADNKKHDSCATCHGTTGALVGVAVGNLDPNNCEDCHGAYFPSHQNPDARHDNRTISFGTLGSPCGKCHHSDTTLGLGVPVPLPGVGTLASQSDIDSLHGRTTNACNLCHFYDIATQGNDENLPLEATVTNTIVAGMDDNAPVAASCISCHSYNENPATHGGHLVPDTITTKQKTCTVCHDRDEDNPLLVVDDIHLLTCGKCHETPQPPALIDPATRPNADTIVEGDCGDCHGDYDHDNDTHSKITYGNDVVNGNGDCIGCHVADPITEHIDIRGWECSVCHRNPCFDPVINDAINGVTNTVYCTDCHTDRDFPHGMIDHVARGKVSEDMLCANCHNPNGSLDWLVNIHGNGTESDCGMCHVNPNGAGALIAVLENDANAVDGGLCSECHNNSIAMPNHGAFHGVSASDPETISRHNNLMGATGVAVTYNSPNIIDAKTTYKCNDCHLARTVEERLNEHPGCVICHNNITDFEAVITAGKASGGNSSQDCEACHNDTINGGGNANSPTGQAMEQYDGLRHHTLEPAQKGRCDYCHTDPRPDWAIANGAALPDPIPTQLPCITCHMDTTANGVLVKKNTYSPTSVYFPNSTGWTLSTVSSVAQVDQHTIIGAAPIAVTNYGACLFCHSINIWHAKPDWNRDVNDTASSNQDDPFDVLRQAPGRSWWPSQPTASDNNPIDNGGIAKFDIFVSAVDTGGATKARMFGRYNFGDSNKPYRNTGSENRGDVLYKRFKTTNPWINTLANAPLGFTRVTVPQIDVVNDAEGLMTSNPKVPVFAAISEPAITGVDSITAIDAGWNDGNLSKLDVMAVNRHDNSVSLTVTYGTQITDAPMTWDASLGAWTYTSASMVLFDGSDVVISSNHAGGGSDTITPRDMTIAAAEAGQSSTTQLHVNNAANNIPATVLAAGPCNACHLGNLALEHAKRGKSCSVCHAPCADPSGYDLATIDCFTCHYDNDPVNPRPQPADHPADALPNHFFLEYEPDKCTSCHSSTNIASVTHSTCGKCHDAIFDLENMQAGPSGNARLHITLSNSGCTVCHPGQDADFGVGHFNEDHANITASAQCVSCHIGDRIESVHGNNCNLCHTDSVTNGSLKGSASGHTIGVASACADCHPNHAANFVSGHQNEDHANVVATTGANIIENCAGCHPGNVITDAALHNNTCEKCHTNQTNNGSLRSGPLGDATTHTINTQSGCADCHDGHFTDHTHVHSIIAIDETTDLGQADDQPCYNCHNDTSNNLVAWADILTEHRNLCSTCHNATRLTGNPGAPTETVQDIINAKNDPTNCLDCHWDKEAPNTHTVDHASQGRVAGAAQCVSCHDKDGVGTNDYYIVTIHDMATNGCGLCHLDPNGAGPLVDRSGGGGILDDLVNYEAINSGAGGSCTVCHASYAANFGSGHENADHSGLGYSANCTSCHDGDVVYGDNTHHSSCSRCHTNTTTDGTLIARDHGTAENHYLGTTSECADCHANYSTDFAFTHDVADHSGISDTGSCQGCHSGHVVDSANTHNSVCSKCHTNLTDNGTLKSGANGDATHHSLSSESQCATCHTDYTPDFAQEGAVTAHKVKDHSGLIDPTGNTPTTNCILCHDGVDRRPNVEWYDYFTGLTTGDAGRSTFSNWTGVNGSDGTNPWMIWTGPSASSGTGPSAGYAGGGEYVLFESSSTAPVSGAVSRIGNWSSNFAATTGNAIIDYTVPEGDNRVMVVAISAEDSGQVNITGATYGGQALTMVNSATQGTGYSNETWIGICKETCISNAAGTILTATFAGTHSTGMTIGAATYQNVDQTTPVSDHSAVNNASDTISTNVTNPEGGKVIYAVEFNGVGDNTISPPAGFTEMAEFNTGGSGFRAEIGERDATSAGAVTVNPTHTAPNSNRTTIVAIALNPAAGDQDAVNGVDVTAGSSHYLESAVLDASASSLTFNFMWNMNVSNNADASLHVDAWNGSSWDLDVNGGTVNSGSAGNNWTSSGSIDLSTYNNTDFKIRIRYEVGTGTLFQNDLAIDDMVVVGTPKQPILFSWKDQFTGLTTGAAGRSSFGHWTGANGSDATNPWMVWNGATATSGTGPSSGNGGEYVVIESSPTTPAAPEPVTLLGSWSTALSTSNTNATLNYTVPAGNNRVMVVFVSAEDDTLVALNSVTYGGQTVTPVDSAIQGTGYSNLAWVGLCDEDCIAAASGNTLTPSFGATGHLTGMTIAAATYGNVDQTTPINDNNSLNTTSNTISVNVSNASGGQVLYLVGFNGVGANSISPPAGFTETVELDTTGSGYRAEMGTRDSTASGTVTVNPTNTGTASNRTVIVAVALKPAPSDSDATNGVDMTANSTHYLESDVMDASTASITFKFSYNMNVSDNADATLHVDAWNGSSWDLNANGATVATGNKGNIWTAKGPIDFASYTNANFKIRIRYEAGTGTVHLNDLALDNLILTGSDRVVVQGDVHYDECTTCHAIDGTGALQTKARGDASLHELGVDSECAACHGPYGYFDAHLHSHDLRQKNSDISQSNNQACSNCHGVLSMWANVLTTHGSSCINCHEETRDINPVTPTGTKVSDVIKDHSGTVGCLDCHADKLAPAEHGVIDHFGLGNVTWSAKCAQCHNAGGSQDVIYDVHKVGSKNKCGICHENPYGVGPLREPWETNSPAGGECITCHGSDTQADHHAKEQAQGGDCTYCHNDPRPDWVTTYGTLNPTPMAKQLACVECHVKPDGTGLVVYANTYNPGNISGFPSGNRALPITGGTRVTQTAVHTITGQNKINVYNYGACLNCHDGNTVGAPQIQVWHAKPTWNKNTHDTSTGVYDDPFDTLRYAPGRSEIDSSANIIDSKFNIFYNGTNTGTTKVRMYGRYDFGRANQPYRGTSSQTRGKNFFDTYQADGSNPWFNDMYNQRFQIPCVAAVNDPLSICNGTDPFVPYFNDITEPDIYDNIIILRAEWNGTNVTVWAYNDYKDTKTLTFDYGVSYGNAMTWNAASSRWEGTLAGSYRQAITVHSDSAGGGSATANVEDLTAVPDSLFVTRSDWTSDNGGTLTIHSEHLLNNGTLAYNVTYGFISVGEMTWNGVDRRYEVVKTGVQYQGDILVHIESTDPGGDAVDVPVEDVSGPPQDAVYATRAVWDGNNLDTLVIYATHKLNSGVLTYKVDYNGYNNNVMTWKSTRFRYELFLEGVTFDSAATARIYSDDPGGDEITVEVTDITGSVDHESLGHVTQTAECAKCHNWNPSDPKDVVTDIHKGKCTLCHSSSLGGGDNMLPGITAGNCEHCHTPDYHPANTLHDQITYGYGGNGCLMSCHKPVPLDEHLTGAVTGRTWQCTSCHASPYYIGIINAAIPGNADPVSPDYYPVYCTDCHANQTFPHGVRHHDITNLENCVSCHSNVDVVNVIHKANCATCHEDTVRQTVKDVITAGGGTCANCHADEYQHIKVGWHNNSILPSCNKCHTAGTFEDIVNTHRDTCATCHASADPTVQSVIDIGGAVSCDMCHTWNAADRHHVNDYAQKGDCGYCHTDPRPDWVTTYGTINPSPLPKQLACVKCHVKSTGTGLVVYSNTYTPVDVSTTFPNGTSFWGVTGDASVQQTEVHNITGTAKIDPYNYGVCLSCHFYDADNPSNAALPVQIWHAKPSWDKDTNDTSGGTGDNAFDVLRTAPGRSYYANNNTPPLSTSDSGADDRRFNIFATGSNTGGLTKARMYGRYTFNADSTKPYKGTTTQTRGKDMYRNYRSDAVNPWVGSVFSQRVTIPDVNAVNDREGLMSSNPQVPYYNDIAVPVVTQPDDVFITSAQWYETDHDTNVGDLMIGAFNRETSTLQYNATDMTLDGNHWHIVINNVANPGTVTVTSTYVNGGSDNATVTDMTCYDCIQDNTLPHDYIENLVDPSCGECHNANLVDEHAVHGLSCSNCHNSTDPVVMQAINVGVYGGVTCETCHGARTAEHPYDLHIHSAHLDPTDLGQPDSQPCGNCHQSATWYEISSVTHNVVTNGPGPCNTCHLSSRVEVLDTIKYRISGDAHCISCHTLMKSPAAHGNDHLISLGAGDLSMTDSQPCSNCHGTLDSWSVIYQVHLSNCDTCHTATRDINPNVATGTTIPQVIAALNPVNCLGCHDDKGAPDEHGLEHLHIVPGVRDSNYNATLTCFTAGCHAESTYTEHMKPGGIAYQKFEDAANPFQCDWCHQYRPVLPGLQAYNDDPVISAAISTGINDAADVYCSDCHAYSTQRHDPLTLGWDAKYANADYRVSSQHHDNSTEALNGNCNACHVDKREDRYGVGLPVPTPSRMACIACHVDEDPYGGTYSTGQVTVYKTKTADLIDHGTYFTWDWTFQTPVANTEPIGQTGMPHRWDVVGGQLDNYGTCLFCHRIGPFHAKPALPPDDPDKNVYDFINDPPYLQNVGRGLFNAFFAGHRKPLDYYTGNLQDALAADYRLIRDSDSWAREDVTWRKVIYDPYSNPLGNVDPTHVMGTPETFIVPTFDAPAGGDTVSITNTTFNTGPFSLDVTATNTATGQGYELWAIHNGQSVLMTEAPAGTWNGSINTGYNNDVSDEIGAVYVISVDPASNHITLAQDATNPTPIVNNPPAITITQPGGAGVSITQGDSTTITYNLSDTEETVTAAFYFDNNNSGVDGTAIGTCTTEPEATGGICSWNTTGVTPGTYYVYAISNDGVNPQMASYSSGTVTINPPAVIVGGGVGGVYQSSTESWQMAMYDLNNPFTAAASGTVKNFTVYVTNPGNFTLFVCAPTGGEGGTCAVNATTGVSTTQTGNVTWNNLAMPIANGEVIGIWHALGDGIGEKITVGLREQYQLNAPVPTTASTVNGSTFGVSLMMEATVEY